MYRYVVTYSYYCKTIVCILNFVCIYLFEFISRWSVGVLEARVLLQNFL